MASLRNASFTTITSLTPKLKTQNSALAAAEFWIVLAPIASLIPRFNIQNSAGPAANIWILYFASYHYLFTTKIQNPAASAAGFWVLIPISNFPHKDCIHCFYILTIQYIYIQIIPAQRNINWDLYISPKRLSKVPRQNKNIKIYHLTIYIYIYIDWSSIVF